MQFYYFLHHFFCRQLAAETFRLAAVKRAGGELGRTMNKQERGIQMAIVSSRHIYHDPLARAPESS